MAEGDYPGGRTAWENCDVPQMAGYLNEHLGAAWAQARAWFDTASMAASYAAALWRFRENLATVWPPERSPAARAYLARLDSLIASVDDTADATAGTGEALNGLLTTLDGAKPGMQQLLAEWQQGAVAAAGQAAGVGGSDQLWQVELNKKAQQQMHELDAAVFPYQSRMRAPQFWEPPRVDDLGDAAGGSGDPPGGTGG